MSNKVQKMVSVSMFAAMGLVMQFVAFPILPVFPFLKIDFSDIPVLLSMFLYGPMAGEMWQVLSQQQSLPCRFIIFSVEEHRRLISF